MSSMMNKIADALTGHHANTNTNTNNTTSNTSNLGGANAPAGNQQGGVGPGYSGTNYSAQNNGGAQVRDTGMNAAKSHTAAYDSYNKSGSNTSSNLGRDAELASGAAGAGALGSSSYNSASNSSLSSSTTGSTLGSSSSTTQSAALGRQQQTGTYDSSNDNAMTRSEEHLLVGKEKVNVGKAILNKYVTTEKVSTAVPIIKEHAVVEREPITDANRSAALSGPDFKEATYEVNLMEERAVAEKEAVPIERVRLRKEVEQTQQYVEAELRKEHIELIDPTQNVAAGGKTLGTGMQSGMQSSQSGLGRNAQIDSTTSSSARRNL